MSRIFFTATIVSVLLVTGVLKAWAKDKPLNVTEFRQLYDSLLSGKTLLSETKKEGGVVIRKERRFYAPIDVGDGEFEIPITVVVTKMVDGKVEEKDYIGVLDRVNNVGGQTIVSEELRQTTVERPGEEPRTTKEVEFGGLFRVARNEKGGFDVHNFGLIPSVLADEGSLSLAGTMVSYSCFSEGGITKCVLTIRDYKLGDYKPLVGYTLGEPAGGDVVEVSEEVRP